VATLSQAVAAERAGADRLELCGPGDGGTTPSLALVQACVSTVHIPVRVMIRPHADNFAMHQEWHAIMAHDIALSLGAGAVGIVTGALVGEEVDATCMRMCADAASGAPVVFHRAFDRVRDRAASLTTLRECGVTGVLTSGGATRALDGAAELHRLRAQADPSFTIVVGGGVRAENVEELLTRTGAREVHVRATDPDVFARTVERVREWSRTSRAHAGVRDQ
jgi:copper homeostasis protein